LYDGTFSEKLPKIPRFGPSLIHQLQLLGFQQHTLLFSALHIQNGFGQGLLYVCFLFVFHIVYNISGDSDWFRYCGEVISNSG
jgi:hypothetical protein